MGAPGRTVTYSHIKTLNLLLGQAADTPRSAQFGRWNHHQHHQRPGMDHYFLGSAAGTGGLLAAIAGPLNFDGHAGTSAI